MDAQRAQRLLNCISVIETIERSGFISRKQIADETGLSLMTVGKLCALLEECELISEKKEEKSESGRKAAICSLGDICHPCVLNCADNVYLFSLKGEVGSSDVSLLHAAPNDIPFEDKLLQFCDRMNDMLERIVHTPPAAMCMVTGARVVDTTLVSTDGSRADIKRMAHKLCKNGDYSIFSPASAAAAYLESRSSDPAIAAVIGKTLSFALTDGVNAKYEANTVYPNSLRADGVSLGERLQMMGTPDKESVYAFLTALAAFFPDRKIVIFPLADANGALTCGELCRYAIGAAQIEGTCTFCEDPLGAISEGAKYMYLAKLLKKHI